jgi:hypothetical protein
MEHARRTMYLTALSGFVLLLAGCAAPETSAAPVLPPPATPARRPSSAPPATPPATPALTATITPPFFEEWDASAHADAEALAFRTWDGAGHIPSACAGCHSTAGLLDFIGADGSQAGVVDSPARTGSVIECPACHSARAAALHAVVMPSGVELAGLGPEAICIECHQGLASGAELAQALKSLAPDGISRALEFTGVHFGPAAASLFGTRAGSGFEYAGRAYAGRLTHAPGFNTCTGCHDAHSLTVKIDGCGECHPGIDHAEDIRNSLRISTVDFDDDGNTTEGLALEIETYGEILFTAIRSYASKNGNPIVYAAGQEPYFFDTEGEIYQAWTPRLLKAAFNYQFAAMDAGAYAHNPRYIMQLLYDSIQDIGGDILGLIRP